MSSHDLAKSHFITVKGAQVHYLEQGSGDPILFLHGIPTSSYIWRNVMPHLSTLGRCIAPDLIGMGQSDNPNIEYTIKDHIDFIQGLIDQLHLKNVTLVMHGWGSIVGFHYAMQHQANCKGLVFYEAYVRPMQQNDISLPYQEQIVSLQAQENLHELILNGTYFIDTVLPQCMLTPLADQHLSFYRKPFAERGKGRALMQYLREVPKGNNDTIVDKIINQYSKKLTESNIPKLLLYSVPGFITTISTVMWAKENLPNLEIVEVGEDLHYAQESNPTLMGETISVWLQGVEQNV